jgi:WYL domain
VVGATLQADPVARPADFDLAAYWAESSAAYERETPRVVVDVRVREDQAWRINQVFGRGTVAGAERVDEDGHPGTVRLLLRLGFPDEAPGMLLAVGPNLEVLGPAEVRDKLVMLATRIADRYREVAAPDAGR